MKKKIAYIMITAAVTTSAFFIGKLTAPSGYMSASEFYATNGSYEIHIKDFQTDELTEIIKEVSATSNQDLSGYLPVSDFYKTSVDENGFLTLHVGDFGNVGDELTGRTYASIIAEINKK